MKRSEWETDRVSHWFLVDQFSSGGRLDNGDITSTIFSRLGRLRFLFLRREWEKKEE